MRSEVISETASRPIAQLCHLMYCLFLSVEQIFAPALFLIAKFFLMLCIAKRILKHEYYIFFCGIDVHSSGSLFICSFSDSPV